VIPPSYRHDINDEIALIGEVARLYGYLRIPSKQLSAQLSFKALPEAQLDITRLRNLLIDKGYQEVITYSFVDPLFEEKLSLFRPPLALLNPISPDLSVMRTHLWPGLLKAYQYNYHRQQSRVRLFELGLCFLNHATHILQNQRLGGLCSGLRYKEQWGESKCNVDFYTLKGEVESILALTGMAAEFKFDVCAHPALHPNKSAAIIRNQCIVGHLGALHPRIAQEFDITQTVYLFDLDLESIMMGTLPAYEAISKFPAIRRDVALLVAMNVSSEKIKEKILSAEGELLKSVQIFDIYQGKGIDPGKKSIALSLFFQHASRTLVDAEISTIMQKIVGVLHREFNATLRD
jgi:phenylalanyl-tRNA synthetase beta chain